jgi:hypothetical protein
VQNPSIQPVGDRSWALRAAMLVTRLNPTTKLEYRGRYQQNLALNLAAGHSLPEAERRAYVTVRQLARWAGVSP